jgi:hypothetical protein
VVPAQIIRSRHEIADVGREVGIGKLSLAAAYTSKVEAKHGNVASCKSPGNPRCSEDVLAAAEAVSEQGESAWLRRQVKASCRLRSGGPGKLNLPRFGHVCSYLLASSDRRDAPASEACRGTPAG